VPPPTGPTLPLAPSVLDRLIDPDAGGPGLRYGYTLEQMMAAVRADIENLLNTHCPYPDMPAEYPETAASVLAFGLPDMTALPVATDAERAALGEVLATVIARYEPRLKNVRVRLQDGGSGRGIPQVKFHIDARLAVDPAP
jgi:type VI secretion system protein ImpF